VPRLARLLVSEVGAVIGAHAGTGLLGIVVVPRDESRGTVAGPADDPRP